MSDQPSVSSSSPSLSSPGGPRTDPASTSEPRPSSGGAATGESGQSRTEQAGEFIDRTVHQASEKLSTVGREVRERSREAADRQKQYAVEELNHIGEAIHSGAQRLHEEGDDRMAHYADVAADQVREVGEYFQNRSMSEVADDAADVARRHPAIFVGGLFAAGLAMGRFLKASPRSGRSPERSASAPPPAPTTRSTAPTHTSSTTPAEIR